MRTNDVANTVSDEKHGGHGRTLGETANIGCDDTDGKRQVGGKSCAQPNSDQSTPRVFIWHNVDDDHADERDGHERDNRPRNLKKIRTDLLVDASD